MKINEAIKNVSFSTVNRWENNKTEPNRLALITIINLAEDSQVSTEFINCLKKE